MQQGINVSTKFAILDGLVENIDAAELGDAVTAYTYFDLLSDGMNAFGIDFVLTATTITFEGSHDEANVADGSAVWRDITSVLTGGAASSYTADGSLTVSAPLPWPRMRVKRVTTDATNACELRLSRIKI